LLAAFGLPCSRPALADTLFHASLTHDQEVANPPIPNEGTSAYAVLSLNDAQTALTYTIVTHGLDIDGFQTPGDPNDNVTRLHIHRAPVGNNGGIVYGMIDGNVALRNDPDDLVVNPVTGVITGVWDGAEGNGTTLAAELANLMNSGLYLNFHTTDHAGGEIRGQVRPVPEPATLSVALTGLALAAFATCRRRTRYAIDSAIDLSVEGRGTNVRGLSCCHD
jgi:hypothetical protein